jgi:hypothetical protein
MFKVGGTNVLASCKGNDGLVCDSKAWKHINNTWHDFTMDPLNIKLGLTLNGVNPYVKLSINYSTWLIFLLNYNLPLWLTTKWFFCDASLADFK